MTTTSDLPRVMNAAVVDAAGPPNAIHIQTVPVPHLAPNHIIVALEYAGVGSWDASERGGLDGAVQPRTILGVDGSGTIAAIGSSVEKFSVGDRVYSYSHGNPSEGFYAEYVSVVSHIKAKAPLAYPNGVDPKRHLHGHPGLAFDGEMSSEAFDRVNAIIGSQTIPRRTEVLPLSSDGSQR